MRLYTNFADKHTDKHSKVTTLKAAYAWASKHLGMPVKLSEIEDDEEQKTLPSSSPDSIPDTAFGIY